MGFFGTLLKVGGAIGGAIVGGPAGAVAGFKLASSVTRTPAPATQPYIVPPAPEVVAQYNLPNFSVQGGVGGGPVNTYDPPQLDRVAPAHAIVGSKIKHVSGKRAAKKAKKAAKKAAKATKKSAKKLKFGSPAWRKKHMKPKKKR